MTRRAVVLMNLGGPDSPEAVRPFLRNLFADRAIVDLPGILRLPLASLIAARRAKTAAEIYQHLGGSSPLLANTEAQGRALETALMAGAACSDATSARARSSTSIPSPRSASMG